MAIEQTQFAGQTGSTNVEKCSECGNRFSHTGFIDHLFKNKECMRRYWKDEEKTHIYRLRHRAKPSFTI